MSANDASDFVDSDFRAGQKNVYSTPLASVSASAPLPNRPPTREEIESMVSEKQLKLADLKRAQEELGRRQSEFQTGRQEMLQNLTRGTGLLEESELTTRRDADQMARSLSEFKDALHKIQAINEHLWTNENMTIELTRALTTIENARMEWNAARTKFGILSGNLEAPSKQGFAQFGAPLGANTDFLQLCKIGLALTWPIVVLLGIGFMALLLRGH